MGLLSLSLSCFFEGLMVWLFLVGEMSQGCLLYQKQRRVSSGQTPASGFAASGVSFELLTVGSARNLVAKLKLFKLN